MASWYKRTCSPSVLISDLKSLIFWRDVFLEGVCTTILITSILLVIITNNLEAYKPNTLHIGITAAMLVFVLLEAFGPLCEVHLNPAVSVPFFIAGRTTLTRAVAYITVQLLAGVLSAFFGFCMTPESSRQNIRAIRPAPTMTFSQSIMVEAFLTFILLFVIMSVTDPLNRPTPQLPGFVIGSTVGLGALLAGTHSGGLLNPIVSLTPALITGDFRDHAIYWIGPLLGGTIGVLFYNVSVYIKFRFTPKPNAVSEKTAINEEHSNGTESSRLMVESIKESFSTLRTSDI